VSEVHTEPYNPQGGRFAAWLFVGIFLYFWIGINPLPDISAWTPNGSAGETSNLFNQLTVLTMSAMVLTVLVLHPARSLVLRAYWPIAAVFFWLVITLYTSDTSAAAMRKLVFAGLVCLSASMLLLLPRDSSQFAKLVGFCLLAALGLSYFGVIFMPNRAIHQAWDALEPALAGDWRGHFLHKNTAAAAMVLVVFFGLYLLKERTAWLGGLLTGLALIMLVNTGGKTSAAMLPLIILMVWVLERVGSMRVPLVVGLLGILNFVVLSVSVSDSMRAFVVGLGIDPTFTDRSAIWQLGLWAVEKSPLTGYGFSSFWQSDALVYGGQAASTWAATATSGHNAYLDQLLNGGWPLLVLMVIWLIVLPGHHAGIALKRGGDPELTRLYMRIWLFVLLSSAFESYFLDNGGPLWFTMLIAVFGLRLQAHANLVDNPDHGTAPLSSAVT
jgi:O-antigen ligase